MKELKIVGEASDTFVLSWGEVNSDFVNEYIVEGMTKIFTYTPIARVKETTYVCNKNNDYVGYRIAYAVKIPEQEFIVDRTNTINIETNLTSITIIPLKSADEKISLSFRAEEQYDLYRLFDEDGQLLAETEDCIVIGEYNDKKCFVKGYINKDDGYKLKGISDITICKPIVFKLSSSPILSIVIPVYNGENFLPRTIQSILSSTFTDFEIVLMDDGSNETTRKLCDWYSENYNCIRTIHNKKSTIFEVRNKCLDEAKCEWMAFCDSDDIIHPYMYEKLFAAANEYGTEIAISQCIMRTGYEKYEHVLSPKINQNIILMNSYKEVIESKHKQRNLFFVSTVNKIVKTEKAKKVRFDENLLYYEDVAYTNSLYSYLDKFVLVKDAYYIWDQRKRQTEGTLSTQVMSKSRKASSEFMWQQYFLSCSEPLVIGNPDKKIADVYKYDVLKHLLTKYTEKVWSEKIKNVMTGILKYLVRKYELPVEQLKNNSSDTKLYDNWIEVQKSNIKEYDGKGNIPKEYL